MFFHDEGIAERKAAERAASFATLEQAVEHAASLPETPPPAAAAPAEAPRPVPQQPGPVPGHPEVRLDGNGRYVVRGFSFSGIEQALDYAGRLLRPALGALANARRAPLAGPPRPIVAPPVQTFRPSPPPASAPCFAPAPAAAPPRSATPLWIATPTQLVAGGMPFRGDMVYYGAPHRYDPRHDCSRIDPRLPVDQRGDRYGTTLDYWPTYTHLDPRVAHRAGQVLQFDPGSGELVHDRLTECMREVLEDDDEPAYLDPEARRFLGQARGAYRELGLGRSSVFAAEGDAYLMTWHGSEVNGLLAILLQSRGMACEVEDAGLSVTACTPAKLLGTLAAIDECPPLEDLSGFVENISTAKLDAYIDEALLRRLWCWRHESVRPRVTALIHALRPGGRVGAAMPILPVGVIRRAPGAE